MAAYPVTIERDGDWFLAFSEEVRGANGHGRTESEARQNLADAIELILEDEREARADAR